MFENDLNTPQEYDKSTSLEIYTKSLLTFVQIEIITVYVKKGSNVSQDSYKAGEIVLHLVLKFFFSVFI